MGDRAVIIVTNNNGDAPVAMYLHNGGCGVGALLAEAAPKMRAGDADYARARLCGVAHERSGGILGLGLFAGPKDLEPATLKNFSHGDAGVFVVNVDTGDVETFGGYGWGGNAPALPLRLCAV
jgi:hypothetical protein